MEKAKYNIHGHAKYNDDGRFTRTRNRTCAGVMVRALTDIRIVGEGEGGCLDRQQQPQLEKGNYWPIRRLC